MIIYENKYWRENLDACKNFKVTCPALKKGQILRMFPASSPDIPEAQALASPEMFLPGQATAFLAVGSTLVLLEHGKAAQGSSPLFTVLFRSESPVPSRPHAVQFVKVRAEADMKAGEYTVASTRSAPALAWVTISDKGSVGLREDKSGPLVEELLQAAMPLRCSCGYLVPDDIHRLRALVLDLALLQGYDLVITSGGTGVAPRDNTPEALLPLLDKRLPGFEQAMMAAALAVTPKAAISRAICGIIGQSVLITLPGSSKAVQEDLQPLLGALAHTLEKLHGGQGDCGR